MEGVWIPSGKKTAIISIYAPQDIRDKKLLWEYLSLVISNWKGDVIVMGDFNEVRSPNERYGSVFNSQGANIFNQFISSAGLEELPLGGCKYTWCHKTGTKMSKLDRFLVSDGLWRCYPDMSSIMLDRFLSDHRPILMRESHHDYGPTPFRFYHYWFDLEGFDKFVEETWMNAPQDDTNDMVKLTKKLRYLKQHIRTWIKDYKFKTRSAIQQIKDELSKIDVLIDKGEVDSNIDIIIRILDCFYHASGLKINMSKSKLLGISVHRENVAQAAQKIGCDILQTPFSYLGSKVGGLMSRVQSWDEIINIIVARLSRWKMQTLSIGGRFTLIKSVLGSIPIYHMSLFRVPIQVLRKMESIRGRFFNGSSQNGMKHSWVKWKNVMSSIQNGGLGVSSLLALNRALLFKWVWRFFSYQSCLWSKVIKGIHGIDGNIGRKVSNQHPSLWLDIIKEVNLLQNRGIDLMSFLQRRMGNGEETLFWDDKWRGDIILKTSFPHRLECIEEAQYNLLTDFVQGVTLSDAKDCFRWSLEGSGEFTVSSTRRYRLQTNGFLF
ncbi:RNA-directed DNA polymerase, eukaryota, reverse transcriptase zinc-binding domain protein [Tanacetum coccineum]